MSVSLEHRVQCLERSNRRWRGSCVALIGLVAGSFLISAEKTTPPSEIVQTKRFELIGPDGQAAVVMQAKSDGASLAVWGPDHQHAVVLVGQAKKAALMLMKDPQTPEVFAEAVDQGGQIGVTDGKSGADASGERTALNLTGSPSGFNLMQIVNGKPESRLSFSRLGGGLELRTPGSKAATRILGSDKGGRVEILNSQGQLVWSAPQGTAENR